MGFRGSRQRSRPKNPVMSKQRGSMTIRDERLGLGKGEMQTKGNLQLDTIDRRILNIWKLSLKKLYKMFPKKLPYIYILEQEFYILTPAVTYTFARILRRFALVTFRTKNFMLDLIVFVVNGEISWE